MYKFLTFLILISFLSLPAVASAQSATCTSDVRAREPAACAELDKLVKEEIEAQKEVDRLKGLGAGFASDIKFLTAKINTAQANIKSKNNQIALLTKDIAIKQSEINVLDNRIVKGKRAIADILRKTNDINSYSLVETMLSDKNLSEFFIDMDSYASTEKALQNLFAELRTTRALTEAQKANLAKKREAEAAAKAAIETAKKQVETANAEKKTLLAINDATKKGYEQFVADRKAKAAKIRAVLFPLVDAGAIPFGTALAYAEEASAKTGVRAALILGILQQESNLGANVGRCIITDLSTGQTKNVNSGYVWQNGIHPTRDLPLLQKIIGNLGRDPLSTRVSCPIAGVPGYGGAMGPTQFIPSTWNLISGKIAAATGKATPDPWNPADAIMASAILLQGNGAATQDWTNERPAACKYYSGRICGTASHIMSYGNQVMNRVAIIQTTMIDPLQNL